MQMRSLKLALASSLLLVAVFVAPTQASTGSASAQQFNCPFGFCMTTAFGARWSVSSFHGEGSYEWEFSKLWIDASVGQGALCPQCKTFWYATDVYFYNAAGTLLRTLHSPPISACGGHGLGSTGDYYISRCQSVYYVPSTVTRLKVHWRIDITNCCGWTVNSAYEKTSGFIAVP